MARLEIATEASFEAGLPASPEASLPDLKRFVLDKKARAMFPSNAGHWVKLADAESQLSALRMEVQRLTQERDAAFAMSKCECSPDECCANLADLKAHPNVEACMAFTDDQIDRAGQVWSFAIMGGKGTKAAREALLAELAKG